MATTTEAAASPTMRERRPILAALMLCMALVALDSTIVATAVPAIVRDLGGFAQFPWLFSIYLLTQAVTVPLYGRFADVIGRKPVLFFGVGVFLAGSALSGFAWNMPSLIAFRAVQGIGAGAVMPITATIAGDIYTVEERARIQGFLSSVWAVAAVVGPTIGGFFTQYLTWPWIFFVNLPVGAAALAVLGRYFREDVVRRRHRIDYAGATTLVTGCSLVILGLLEGGVRWPWTSATSVAVFVAAAALLGSFVLIERRSPEPVLPLWVFGRRTTGAGNLAAFAVGALTLGISSYVPTYVQGVQGTGAVVAGFALAAMSVGWPATSTVAGRVYVRVGFRDTALGGSLLCIAGTLLFASVGQGDPVWRVALASFVVGAGLGFASTSVLVAVQSVVGWERRGVVTGTNMFTRSIGSAVGVAVFGAIANSALADRLRHPPAALAGQLPQHLDTTTLVFGAGNLHDRAAAFYLRSSLYDAIHLVFWALVAVAVAGFVFEAVLPRRTSELTFDAG